LKRITSILLALAVASTSVFALNEDIGTGVTLEGKAKASAGYSLDNEAFGITDQFDIDFKWGAMGYGKRESEVSDDTAPHGIFSAAGFELSVQRQDIAGRQDAAFNWIMDLGQLWARVVLNPMLTLHVASDGSSYKRAESGYNFMQSFDAAGSNLAHIGARFQYSTYRGQWDDATVEEDIVSNNVAENGNIGLLFDLDMIKGIASLGTASDWNETNDDQKNKLEGGLALEVAPLDPLLVQAMGNYSMATEVAGYSAAAQWKQDVTDDISVAPRVAYDGKMFTADSYSDSEISAGVTVVWPGISGYGHHRFLASDNFYMSSGFDAKGNRYSGLDAGLTYGLMGADNAEDVLNARVTMLEETEGGLIPNLGMTFFFEVKDILDASKAQEEAYGVYVDYLINGNIRPALYVGEPNDDALHVEASVEYTGIENTAFQLSYKNDRLVVLEGTTDDALKGTITANVVVTF